MLLFIENGTQKSTSRGFYGGGVRWGEAQKEKKMISNAILDIVNIKTNQKNS